MKEKKRYKEIPDAHLQRIENLKKSKGIVKNAASKETNSIEWTKPTKKPWKKKKLM